MLGNYSTIKIPYDWLNAWEGSQFLSINKLLLTYDTVKDPRGNFYWYMMEESDTVDLLNALKYTNFMRSLDP